MSARRLGPRIVGSARLTSITTESWSRTRVRLQSQAQRSTVFDEIGRENSVSAPGAPVRSSRVFVLNGVPAPWLRGESLHLDLRLVACQLDQGVGHPLRSQPVVVLARVPGKGFQSVANHRAADRVQGAGEKERSVIAPVHEEDVRMHQRGLLVGVFLGADRVPVVKALVVELAG